LRDFVSFPTRRSSDLAGPVRRDSVVTVRRTPQVQPTAPPVRCSGPPTPPVHPLETRPLAVDPPWVHRRPTPPVLIRRRPIRSPRSEEPTSELQSRENL